MNYLVTHHCNAAYDITLVEAKSDRNAIEVFKALKPNETIISIWDGRVISHYSDYGISSNMLFSNILDFQFDRDTGKFSARTESGL